MSNKNNEMSKVYIPTLAGRLRLAIYNKNTNTIELAKLAGVSRHSISHILNNNVKKSKLTMKLAMALGVSYNWLAYGVEDASFSGITVLPVFNNIYSLFKYLNTGEIDTFLKNIANHKLLEIDSFVFNPENSDTHYYCTKNTKIISTKYLKINIEKSTFSIEEKNISKFSYPIIEIKTVLL